MSAIVILGIVLVVGLAILFLSKFGNRGYDPKLRVFEDPLDDEDDEDNDWYHQRGWSPEESETALDAAGDPITEEEEDPHAGLFDRPKPKKYDEENLF